MIRMSPHELYETLNNCSHLRYYVVTELLGIREEMCQDCILQYVGYGKLHLCVTIHTTSPWNFANISIPVILDQLEYALDKLLDDTWPTQPAWVISIDSTTITVTIAGINKERNR